MEKRVYKVAVIGGDGIGPEVLAEGIKVLKELPSWTVISVLTLPIFPGAANTI